MRPNQITSTVQTITSPAGPFNKVFGMVLFLTLLQGVILLGPQFLGNWAHDNFHSYRHSIGMACH